MCDDNQLIHAALGGSAEAFGQLVRRYQDRLYHTVKHVVGSAEDARDVVQEAFTKAFTGLERFQQNSTFYTWLCSIALNAARTHLRRQRSRRAQQTCSIDARREIDDFEPLAHGSDPQDDAQRNEQVAQVWQALARLDDDHRQVVVLREIDGLSYEQIAQVLELPIGTVRSRLFRARTRLRDLLKQTVGDDNR